jgi:hypothetical protein
MFRDEGHPDVPPSDWNAFRNEFSPYLFDEILDRSSVALPYWFMPLARGIAIPSTTLLAEPAIVPAQIAPAVGSNLPGKTSGKFFWWRLSGNPAGNILVPDRIEWLVALSAARPLGYDVDTHFRINANSYP